MFWNKTTQPGRRRSLHPLGGKKRRKGMGIVYVVATVPFMLMIAAFAVDLSFLYYEKAEAQKAADAAALAAAFSLANFGTEAQAKYEANKMLARDANSNYTRVSGSNYVASPSSTVTLNYPFVDRSSGTPVSKYNQFEVVLTRTFPAFFAGIMGHNTLSLKARAVAEYSKLAPMSINGMGTYGTAPGPVNLSVFGPAGFYNNGDCYSSQYLPDGSPNPLYTGKGYNFNIDVPFNFGNTTLEIFDPECWNASNQVNAGGGTPPKYIDEFRMPNGNAPGSPSSTYATTTKYTLYWDANTRGNFVDDVQLWTGSYGFSSTTDMKWNEVFTFNRANYPTGQFRLNVTSTAGASENGFDLRIGPKRSGTQQWNPNNGTVITADGHLPINFNTSGTVTMTLGSVPVGVAGGVVQVRKFDTDVGSTSVTYTCSTLPGMTWPGVLSGQGSFVTDTLQIPLSYNREGIFYATYEAGLQDTSVWDMTYTGYVPGTPGGIKLVE